MREAQRASNGLNILIKGDKECNTSSIDPH